VNGAASVKRNWEHPNILYIFPKKHRFKPSYCELWAVSFEL